MYIIAHCGIRNNLNQRNWMKKRILNIAIIINIVLLLAVFIWFQQISSKALVVYCAHDSVYAEKILKQFEQETGIKVMAKFDTEATKSLGLLELIKSEKNNPRCDVFWNNEVLGTMDLKREGLLQPYKGSGYQRIPENFKDPDGNWAGFAARLRVYIINKDKLPVTEQAVQTVLKKNLHRMAIAKPLYGTTLTHYTCLWREKGEEELKQQDADWKKKGVKILNGNAAVKDAVAAGGCDMGLTDTDDFFVAYDAGKNVEMLPVKMADGQTICIPNSVAIIKGSKHTEKARKLVDFLLSERCELMLANSKARQIPLGSVDESKLLPEVKKLKKWGGKGTPLTDDLLDIRQKCIQWLKTML